MNKYENVKNGYKRTNECFDDFLENLHEMSIDELHETMQTVCDLYIKYDEINTVSNYGMNGFFRIQIDIIENFCHDKYNMSLSDLYERKNEM